jgi:plasmid stability protein
LDDRLKLRLKRLAAEHGRSMEEEARAILMNGINSAKPEKFNLGEEIDR